jgi:hypothetical protein
VSLSEVAFFSRGGCAPALNINSPVSIDLVGHYGLTTHHKFKPLTRKRFGDFSTMNARINSSRSSTTHLRLSAWL